MNYGDLPPCGCWYNTTDYSSERAYLPQVDLKVHSTVLSTSTQTNLTQTFVNLSEEEISQATYTFPLYDGVSVRAFRCKIGDRTIYGLVKEREEARREYNEALGRGETAALLEQYHHASDTFTTSIGRLPARVEVVVDISYIGELQNDAQVDGFRFTIPTAICPRYGGRFEADLIPGFSSTSPRGNADITVDVKLERQTKIQQLQSPSHPVSITLGQTSVTAEDVFKPNQASATLTIPSKNGGVVQLNSDFVLIIKAPNQDQPFAFFETHPTLQHQRAVLASVVPKFDLPQEKASEIVFVIDRSGSMGDKISMLKSAITLFVKSLPVGISFNICSFGHHYSFMWEKSKIYDASSFQQAMQYIETVDSNMGGTEMLQPIMATVENRFKDLELSILLLTDGGIWDQHALIRYVDEAVSKNPIRIFTLGIGDSVSSSLINGVARAGNGFAQIVSSNESFDTKIVRMLKAALTPHITNYTAEIEYDRSEDVDTDEFVLIEEANQIEPVLDIAAQEDLTHADQQEQDKASALPKPLFDPDFKETNAESEINKFDAENTVPTLATPRVLQSPYKMPSLYPFMRVSVYFLLSPEASRGKPKAVTIKAKSKYGLLNLTVPIEDAGEGITIHQLTVRKITQEFEEGRGWIFHVKDKNGENFMDKHESKKSEMVKREAVRLATSFQVGCKWCSFVAVDSAQRVTQIFPPREDPRLDASSKTVQGPTQVYHFRLSTTPVDVGINTARLAAFNAREASIRRRARQKNPRVEAPEYPARTGKSPRIDYALRRPIEQGQFLANEAKEPNKVNELISLQTFEGAWPWMRGTFTIMGLNVDGMTQIYAQMGWRAFLEIGASARDEYSTRDLLTTLVVIVYLHKICANEKGKWELVCRKALGWANKNIQQMGGKGEKTVDELLGLFQAVF